MTIEEAIKWYKDEIRRLEIAPRINGCTNPEWEEQIQIHTMAIAALRAQSEAEKNEPLTLEKLQEVHEQAEFGSHIWVKDMKYGYVIAAITDRFDGDVCAVWSYGNGNCYLEHDYGKTWLAYRRKPEEGTK